MEFHPLAKQQQEQEAAAAAAGADVGIGASSSASPPVPTATAGSWHTHPPIPKRDAQKCLRLTPEQLASYDRDGYLLLKAKDVWTPAELKLIISSVDQMGDWPDKAGYWMKVNYIHSHSANISQFDSDRGYQSARS